MRLAFVVRLGDETRPADGVFEGWVEEVDSYTGIRFGSAEELLEFLGQRFELAMTVTGKSEASATERVPEVKKNVRKGKRPE